MVFWVIHLTQVSHLGLFLDMYYHGRGEGGYLPILASHSSVNGKKTTADSSVIKERYFHKL